MTPLEAANVEFRDESVGLRPFRKGDRVKFRLCKATSPQFWQASGDIIEVEEYPILMGPVPRVRAKIAGIETHGICLRFRIRDRN